MLQVLGSALAPMIECGENSAGQARDEEVLQLAPIVVSPRADLDAVRCDGVLISLSQLATVENEQKLVPLARVWGPVRDDQGADAGLDREFLFDLAGRALTGSLARVEVAAGNFPAILLGRLDQENASGLVEEQHAGRHPRLCHRLWG